MRPSVLRGRHRRRVPVVRRRRRRRRRRRGRAARTVGCDQRRRRAGRRDHQHRHGPQRVRRPDQRPTSPARRRASSSRGSAVVIGETDPELVQIFTDAGRRDGVRSAASSSTCSRTSSRSAGECVDLRTPTTVYTDVFVPLHGRHQADNAAVALTAVEAFFAAPGRRRRRARGLRRRATCPAGSRCSATSRW